jgi:hypothetical protein
VRRQITAVRARGDLDYAPHEKCYLSDDWESLEWHLPHIRSVCVSGLSALSFLRSRRGAGVNQLPHLVAVTIAAVLPKDRAFAKTEARHATKYRIVLGAHEQLVRDIEGELWRLSEIRRLPAAVSIGNTLVIREKLRQVAEAIEVMIYHHGQRVPPNRPNYQNLIIVTDTNTTLSIMLGLDADFMFYNHPITINTP